MQALRAESIARRFVTNTSTRPRSAFADLLPAWDETLLHPGPDSR